MLESDLKLGYINKKRTQAISMLWLTFWILTSVQFARNVYIYVYIYLVFCDKQFHWFFNSFVDNIFMNGILLHNPNFVMYSSWVICLQSVDLAAKKSITTIAFNCVIFEIIFFFHRYRCRYCSCRFSCNNDIFHFRFMSIHIGIIEHKRDQRKLQYLHGMKKRQRR